MRFIRAVALFLGCSLLATPCQAILLDPTPERILFLGYPPSERNITVKVVRRKESYGIYAFQSSGSQRLLSRDSFVGVVEGSVRGVALDPRAIALLQAWLVKRSRRPPQAQKIGPYYRYYFEQDGWLLKITTRRPYQPSERSPLPAGLVSHLMAKRHVAYRLEQLSRDMDLEHFQLRRAEDLRRIGR